MLQVPGTYGQLDGQAAARRRAYLGALFMRTSQTHPLQIAEVSAGPGMGKIGITFCPGKKQANAASGSWDRHLYLDFAAIAGWNAVAVVTLLEAHELESLSVQRLGNAAGVEHMIWYHLPIRDGGLPDPDFEQTWEQSGRELRAMLRDGFNILVHCKGGLGRAGTIGARLLIELGLEPEEGMKAVRSVRPAAIETAAQLAYVMDLAPIAEELPDTSLEAISERALGAMLGLAVGDALGTTLEFAPRGSEPRLDDLVGGGPFDLKPGQWTDDTAMALALADSLLFCPALDEADLMDRFLSWHQAGEYSCTGTCFDIGITTRQALQRYKRSGNPLAGSADPRSAGNGSLMRLAPVAIRYWNDRPALRDVAARQSRTTHGAPQAIDACIAYAEILADAIAGHPRSRVMRPRRSAHDEAIARIVAGSWRGAHRDTVMSSGYVAHSLEAALWSVGRTGNFTDAVLLAVNLGNDADTTGAITGQLAGALYGASSIPSDWMDTLAWQERIAATAQTLFAQSLG